MIEPSHTEAKVNLGIILDREGKCNDANTALNDAIQSSNSKEPKAFLNLGINLKKAGRLDEA